MSAQINRKETEEAARKALAEALDQMKRGQWQEARYSCGFAAAMCDRLALDQSTKGS